MSRLSKVAEKRTGLNDWDCDQSGTFPKLYEIAVARMNEVQLSPFGRLVTFDYLMRRLICRLEVIHACKTIPEKPQLSSDVLFVIGLPRTGTTLLHRLLALDPNARYPQTFELIDPINTKGYSRKKRIQWLESKLNLIKKVIPHIEAIHELGAEEAEECLLGLSVQVPLLPVTFRHLIRHCVGEEKDFTQIDPKNTIKFPDLYDAYRLYKRQLEFIAGNDEPKRWVLKCPAHLPFIENLLQVFPQAKIVWTHRDPAESLPSLSSMFRTFADMCEYSDINLYAIGSEQLLFWSAAVKKADQQLATCSANQVANVTFQNLLKDPIAVISDIYSSFGWSVSPEFKQNMIDYLDRNKNARSTIPPHLKQFHNYTLQEYGLDRAVVRRHMADYYARHLD
eukprot:CAMPEP_0197319752 /NCGR_PEP_ID=MMETSP0891-20130614/56201_1 /TAXON_ID=44058 ORGANISM="Aureoumbra lagunensis, Strain CCMP1510" /NCGR_SAMPLE_ID=MMETSP0891 /ASSEMBLY_ACC=CAM_ASM_000534 /LENGTH=393 /DNA_ID=CAMNT_0042810849 /DNA_START=225 /DNA_END=1406 /DNA_ORIENTATION=-